MKIPDQKWQRWGLRRAAMLVDSGEDLCLHPLWKAIISLTFGPPKIIPIPKNK